MAAVATPANGAVYYLTEAGREGWFKFSTANLSTKVTRDTAQCVYLPPTAAASGASGAWVRVNYDAINFKWCGATGDGTTNDTTAIQAAINYAAADVITKLYCPIGNYLVTRLTIPARAFDSTHGIQAIEIAGPGQPQTQFATIGSSGINSSGCIIKTVTTGGALLSVDAASIQAWHLVLRDINFRTYDNPNINAVDASQAAQLSMHNVMVDTGVNSVQASQPTNVGITGVWTPAQGNGALTYLRNIAISGYYNGLLAEEHTDAAGINLTANWRALLIWPSNHAIWFGRVDAQDNHYNVVVINSARFEIAQLNIEHSASGDWQDTVEDLVDPSSLGYGKITWSVVLQDVGQDDTFTKNGANHITTTRLGE